MKVIKFLTIILAGLVLVFFQSCEEDQDRLIYDGEAKAFFMDGKEGAFYVPNESSPKKTIKIGLVKPAENDMTLAVKVVDSLSTAVEGTHFTMPETVTIPKGEIEGTIEVTGIYTGFTGEKVQLTLALDTEEAMSEDKMMFVLNMDRFCPFNIEDFVGTWAVNEVSEYNGAYPEYNVTTEIHNGDTLVVHNLWENTPDVYMVFDDTDPSNFTVRIFDQYYSTHSSYGEMRISDLQPGSFNVCNMSISTTYKIYVSAGNFDKIIESNWTFVSP
jgi:hypothetical protein